MEKGVVFQVGRSQAVRMPETVAFPDDVRCVDVITIGRARILIPAGESWDSWFEGEGATADFMANREQPDQWESNAAPVPLEQPSLNEL